MDWSHLWRRGISAGDVAEALKGLASGRKRGLEHLVKKGLLKRVERGYAPTALLYRAVAVAAQA